MIITPIDKQRFPGKRAWDNYTIYDKGRFYAFFNTGTPSEANAWGPANALDIAVSDDGVRWRFLARDLIPIEGAHSGFGVARIGDRILYYPTCSGKGRGVHFKVFTSRDFVHWESLGDDFDVGPDPRWYKDRWDEVCLLSEREDNRDVYYGYISSEVRDDIGMPSVGLLKSYDGIRWQVLPPPVVEWGELPAQHMEVNFCEKMDGRYYLSMAGRFYLDSYGYSLFTFVGDSPLGPFRPDREMFRLSGTSRRSVTWLGHTFHTPEGILVALWLSTGQPHDLPSDNFAIGPLKRLVCEDGHLRLRYWEHNDQARGLAVPITQQMPQWVHPKAAFKTGRDALIFENDTLLMSASRDGSLALFDWRFDPRPGFIIEGFLTMWENRGHIASHQHSAGAGFFLEETNGTGCAMIADTLGVTRTGTLWYADHRIADDDIYALSGPGLVASRSGLPQGTCRFVCEDTVGPFGHASFAGIRHGRKHSFRIIARGLYFELYVDDYYVQTWVIPVSFSGRFGLLAFDGRCRFEGLKAWVMDI